MFFYFLGTFLHFLAGLLSGLLGFFAGLVRCLGSAVTSVFRGCPRLIYCLAGRVGSGFGRFLGFRTCLVSCLFRLSGGLLSSFLRSMGSIFGSFFSILTHILSVAGR